MRQDMIHYSKDLEAAILGICMMEKTAFGRTYGLVEEKNFYWQDNQKVYATLKEMYDSSIPIDLFTVTEKMTNEGAKLNYGEIGVYLCRLTDHVVSSAHIEFHCYLVKKMWRKRELETLSSSGIDPTGDEKQEAYRMSDKINEILSGEVKKDWYSMDELMYNLMVHQQEIKTGKKEFITTGFRKIDQLNGGFSPGNMIVIAARPGVGKSAIIGKMAIAAAEKKKKVGIISLEMNNTEIAARLASLETEFDFSTIYRQLFDDEAGHKKFYDIISKRSIHLPIYVSDKTKVDVSEIKAKAIKLKHAHGLDVLFIDYIQLIEAATNKNYNREQEVAKISRGIKLMAHEMEIPVVVLCQLNRAVTARKGVGRYPQLSDLRESGSIEQDADVVLMLHRDFLVPGHEVNETGGTTMYEADLLGQKWRNGSPFHMKLDFSPEKMKFSEQLGQTLKPFSYKDFTEVEKDEPPF